MYDYPPVSEAHGSVSFVPVVFLFSTVVLNKGFGGRVHLLDIWSPLVVARSLGWIAQKLDVVRGVDVEKSKDRPVYLRHPGALNRRSISFPPHRDPEPPLGVCENAPAHGPPSIAHLRWRNCAEYGS